MDRFVALLSPTLYYYYVCLDLTCKLGPGPKNGAPNPEEFLVLGLGPKLIRHVPDKGKGRTQNMYFFFAFKPWNTPDSMLDFTIITQHNDIVQFSDFIER